MSRRSITAYLAAAALALGAAPVMAQEKPQGARPNNGGSSSGSAVARPSGGGSGGGSTSSSSSAGSRDGGSVSRPVERPQMSDRQGARPSAGDASRERAVPRGSSASSGERGRVSGESSRVSGGGDWNDQRAVPRGARPRDGRPVIGSAVERGSVPNRGSYFDRYVYYYNRYPYGYYYPGYGFGVGYFYDPWMWGYPYGYGYYDPYYGGGYYGGGYYGGGYYQQGQYAELGSLRLKVKPNEAQVFVDGYFAGDVDSFDGIFQRLTLEAGAHRIEIRAPGYEPVQFEVMIVPGETITYKGDLRRIQ